MLEQVMVIAILCRPCQSALSGHGSGSASLAAAASAENTDTHDRYIGGYEDIHQALANAILTLAASMPWGRCSNASLGERLDGTMATVRRRECGCC